MKMLSGILCFAALLAAGCANDAPGDEEEAPKPPIAFVGETPDEFAGTWKTADGRSTYQLKVGGTYALDSKVSVPGRAPIDSHLEGEWRIKGDTMLFRDGRGDVVPYRFELKGDSLELSLTGRLKNKTKLKRQ